MTKETTRWSFEGCDEIGAKRDHLVENFTYMVNKTLYPECIRKYKGKIPNPRLELSPTTTPYADIILDQNSQKFSCATHNPLQFNHFVSPKLIKKLLATIPKFIGAFIEYLSAAYAEDVFENMLADDTKLWKFTETLKSRKSPLCNATLTDGFIMEGKSTWIELEQSRGKRVILEADIITRAIDLENQSILEHRRELIPMVYFLQFCQILYCDDSRMLIDRSGLSFVPFNKFAAPEMNYDTEDCFRFWLTILACTGATSLDYVLFTRLASEPIVEEMTNRTFEAKFYKGEAGRQQLAADRAVFYNFLNNHFWEQLGTFRPRNSFWQNGITAFCQNTDKNGSLASLFLANKAAKHGRVDDDEDETTTPKIIKQ